MKWIRTVVVFDRGGLIDSEQWARMHETITGAVQKIVHPAGDDRFMLRRKVPKLDVHGTPSKKRAGIAWHRSSGSFWRTSQPRCASWEAVRS